MGFDLVGPSGDAWRFGLDDAEGGTPPTIITGSALMVGEVVAFHFRDGLVVDGKVDTRALDPICRLGGPNYATLGEVAVPIRLLGGDRSAAYFRPTLEALAAALPRATLAIIAGAGHMLHAEAPRAFAEHVDALAAATG